MDTWKHTFEWYREDGYERVGDRYRQLAMKIILISLLTSDLNGPVASLLDVASRFSCETMQKLGCQFSSASTFMWVLKRIGPVTPETCLSIGNLPQLSVTLGHVISFSIFCCRRRVFPNKSQLMTIFVFT